MQFNNQYVQVKISTGEEIIAYFLEETNDKIIVMFPLRIMSMISQEESGITYKVTFAPWFSKISDEKIHLMKENIIAVSKVTPLIHSHYQTMLDDYTEYFKELEDKYNQTSVERSVN